MKNGNLKVNSRRAVLAQLGVALTVASCGTRRWGMTNSVGVAMAALGEIRKTGKLGAVTILYWVGGGLPPPRHHTHQLVVYTKDGQDTLEFERTRYDKRFQPPDVQEMWRLVPTPAELRELANQVVVMGAFTTVFGEETNAGIADLRLEDLHLYYDRKEVTKKRFYRRFPESLAPLRSVLDRLIERAMKEGVRTLYHGAEVVADPPGGLSGGE